MTEPTDFKRKEYRLLRLDLRRKNLNGERIEAFERVCPPGWSSSGCPEYRRYYRNFINPRVVEVAELVDLTPVYVIAIERWKDRDQK